MTTVRNSGVLRTIFLMLIVEVLCPFAHGKIIYVDADATGANDGSSWADAYWCLQNALADALSGDEIRLANGIYKPDREVVKGRNTQIVASGDRTATFQLKNGVTIKGGYAGFGEADPDARDIELYETILSGDLGGNDGPNFTNNTENSYHVLTGSGTDATAVLDGFTVTAGNANDTYGYGGGMHNNLCTPTVTNCTFSRNWAKRGGGMANRSRPDTPSGGPTLTNCAFSGNSALWGGGMCYWSNSSGTLTNCTFSGNTAEDGGGIFITKLSGAALRNCTFTGNRASGGTSGAIDCTGNSSATLVNTILWDDSPDEVYIRDSSITVTYSDVQGGWSGAGNINADPLFVDADGPDDVIGTEDDNLRLLPRSPCIDAGDNSEIPRSVVTDLDGNPRIINGIVDMGAYEVGMAPIPDESKYGGGTGEPNDPYLIYTAEQMNAIGLHEEDWDKHFKLMADINLAAYTGDAFNIIGYWVDLGSPDNKPFTGVFDGNGKKISNFTYTSRGANEIGLFGYVSGENAVIKDLGLINPNIDVDAGTGDRVGSLVGYLASGTITNCYVEGGSVSGDEFAGGLLGWNGGRITNCYAFGSVSGSAGVGGLVGTNETGTISNSYSTGSVTGWGGVGGLAGENYGTITNCCATGNVSGDLYVGGLVGWNSDPITNSYAMGSITGNDKVGGLVGWNDWAITNCYSAGPVTGTTDVGGLVGWNKGTITNCYSAGSVVGNIFVGGLVGWTIIWEWGAVTDSFWDIETSGLLSSAGGTGKTTAEMQMQSTFAEAGWDFVDETENGTRDIWWILEGQDYPRLWWQIPLPLLPDQASNPEPADRALHLDTWVILSWTTGGLAVSHDVYFGENFEDVNTGAEGTFQGNQILTFFVVGFPGFPYPDGLVPGTTYYWRVDEVEANGTTIHKGNVWRFTVSAKGD